MSVCSAKTGRFSFRNKRPRFDRSGEVRALMSFCDRRRASLRHDSMASRLGDEMAPIHSTRSVRRGLTLVEVLVIIVVLGFLLCLLVPAMDRTHESSRRRSQCMNNQKELSLALINYEARHKDFPGYVNRVGKDAAGNEAIGSWLTACFRELDRADLAKAWGEGNQAKPALPFTWCPSAAHDHKRSDTLWLSYVVNCGLPGDDDSPATGVFHNHNVAKAPVRVSLPFIVEHDGASCTLLLSENLQAGLWTDVEEANVGMVWRRTPGEFDRINQGTKVGLRPQDIRYARPSSHHSGGVIVSFCDGRVIFLRDDIDYTVYQHLMTPDSQGAGVPGKLDEAEVQ